MKNLITGFIGLMLTLLIISPCKFADERFELKVYVGETIDLDSFLIDNHTISGNEERECYWA